MKLTTGPAYTRAPSFPSRATREARARAFSRRTKRPDRAIAVKLGTGDLELIDWLARRDPLTAVVDRHPQSPASAPATASRDAVFPG